MRGTDWWGRRRLGGAVAVAAVFWLGFVCGGGGIPPGAAATRAPAGTQPQPPREPAPAAAQPQEPVPAPDETASVPAESGPPDAETDAASGPEAPLVQERRREFTAGAGVILHFVRPGGESAFEETLALAAEALAAGDSEESRRQAEGWSTWRAEEPLAGGDVLYVSWIDPVAPGADYWIPGILGEAFPAEAQELYETWTGAFADGQILLNLRPVAGP